MPPGSFWLKSVIALVQSLTSITRFVRDGRQFQIQQYIFLEVKLLHLESSVLSCTDNWCYCNTLSTRLTGVKHFFVLKNCV